MPVTDETRKVGLEGLELPRKIQAIHAISAQGEAKAEALAAREVMLDPRPC